MSLDWGEIFGLTVSPWEMVVRGTAMYWALFVLFRVVIRRRVGAVGMGDILLLVIIADAAQNGMSGDYRSVTDGLILVATIVGWNAFTDYLVYRSRTLQKLLEPPPLLLVDHGRILHRNLRHEFVSEVAQAHMETDGTVSVIKRQARGA